MGQAVARGQRGIWVCSACGKWWRGAKADARDASCYLHAVACRENDKTAGKNEGRETEGWEAV